MPRFALLEHRWNGIHWDLFLESGDVLRTWAIDRELVHGLDLPARRCPIIAGSTSITRDPSAAVAVGSVGSTMECTKPLYGQTIMSGSLSMGPGSPGWPSCVTFVKNGVCVWKTPPEPGSIPSTLERLASIFMFIPHRRCHSQMA